VSSLASGKGQSLPGNYIRLAKRNSRKVDLAWAENIIGRLRIGGAGGTIPSRPDQQLDLANPEILSQYIPIDYLAVGKPKIGAGHERF
jgi:hypothetical protein